MKATSKRTRIWSIVMLVALCGWGIPRAAASRDQKKTTPQPGSVTKQPRGANSFCVVRVTPPTAWGGRRDIPRWSAFPNRTKPPMSQVIPEIGDPAIIRALGVDGTELASGTITLPKKKPKPVGKNKQTPLLPTQ